MWERGFEPLQALSQHVLSVSRLSTPALPHNFFNDYFYKKLYKYITLDIIEDGHNSLETPVPIPNTEVKQAMLYVLVSERK